MTGTAAAGTRTLRPPSLHAALGAGAALVGLVIGLGRLSDNSFFTHLATGRLILEQGSIPTGDPYSFSAPGTPWVVQSWLASVILAGVERVAGPQGIRLLAGLVAAALAALAWRLTAPARSLLPRVGLTGLALVIGATFWAPRPLLFGLLLLALVLVIAEEDRDPRWFVPIFWLWANLHGSFPLGLVALACLALGARLDHESERRHGRVRGLVFAAVGTALAAISPVGPKLLIFPIHLLGRSDVLQRVVEWQSPRFSATYGRVFAIQVVVAVLALCRAPRWRVAIPLVVFVVASLVALRNIPVASLVLLPGMAWGLRDLGTLRGEERGPVSVLLAAAVGVVAVLVTVAALGRPAFDTSPATYPVDAVAWMDGQGLTRGGARVVHTDTTGNYLELLWGPSSRVFLDDRVDMFPIPLLRDYLTLNDGGAAWRTVLDRYDTDLVVWDRGSPFATVLVESPDWRIVYSDQHAIVACRRAEGAAEADAPALAGCRAPRTA